MLFDFGGTLDADGIHWAPRFHAAYRSAGGSLAWTAFEPVFAASDRALALVPGIEDLGFRSTVETQARLLLGLLPDGARVDAASVAERFAADAARIVTRNRPVLERLARIYRLGVISNFTGNLEPCLSELGLRDFFAVALDSTIAGVAKPDQALFRRALVGLAADSSDAWMVGDNFAADIAPALSLGMRACWLAPAERPAPAGPRPTARIARLPEIESILRACMG